MSLSLIRYQSEANIIQLPQFVDTEYSALASALKDDNNNTIKAVTQELDRILRITSSAIYNNTEGLLLGILEETRAYQVSLAKDLKELVDAQKELVVSQKVSPALCLVQFWSNSLQILVQAIGTLVSAIKATGLVRGASRGEDEGQAYKQ